MSKARERFWLLSWTRTWKSAGARRRAGEAEDEGRGARLRRGHAHREVQAGARDILARDPELALAAGVERPGRVVVADMQPRSFIHRDQGFGRGQQIT